jgi:hypothetical protein
MVGKRVRNALSSATYRQRQTSSRYSSGSLWVRGHLEIHGWPEIFPEDRFQVSQLLPSVARISHRIGSKASLGIARGLGLIGSNSTGYFVSELGGVSNGRIANIPYVAIIMLILAFLFDYVYGAEGTQALFTGLATQVIYGGCDADTAEFYSKTSGTVTTDGLNWKVLWCWRPKLSHNQILRN